MKTKYPLLLIHGVAVKESKVVRSFGRIGKILREAGCLVYFADTDGFGTIEGNAEQLKEQVLDILKKENAEKINLIAHSKGGLDAKYMISRLGMADYVASLTTLSTPHRGSGVATWLYKLPLFVKKFIAFWLNFWYRLFGDLHPDALTVCRQLCNSPNLELDALTVPENIFCQSYSSTLERYRDDFLMSVPLFFSRRGGDGPSDGLVSVESAKFAAYRGDCLNESLSHSEMIGYSLKKQNRHKVYDFYLALCAELAELGY